MPRSLRTPVSGIETRLRRTRPGPRHPQEDWDDRGSRERLVSRVHLAPRTNSLRGHLPRDRAWTDLPFPGPISGLWPEGRPPGLPEDGTHDRDSLARAKPASDRSGEWLA